VALLCADIHLSHNAPTARSAEPDWYAAMERSLKELGELAAFHLAPILFAGDLFESWKSPPELINFALDVLPTMYAIAGQHDLPHHNQGEIHKSAYQTLIKAGRITSLRERRPEPIHRDELTDIRVWSCGFPWGSEIKSPGYFSSPIDSKGLPLQQDLVIAVIHDFCWMPGYTYPGAPAAKELSVLGSKLNGYDVAVFGDNHSHFSSKVGDCNVWNCGCLIRRKKDERKYKPTVGLLYSDGHIEPHFLDTSEDKWLDEEVSEIGQDFEGLGEFLSELGELDADSLDFKEAVKRYLREHEVRELTRKILIEGMGE